MKNMHIVNYEYRALSSGTTTITNAEKEPIYIRAVGSTLDLGVVVKFGDSKEFDYAVEGKSTMEGYCTVTVDGSEIDEPVDKAVITEKGKYFREGLVGDMEVKLFDDLDGVTHKTKTFYVWALPFKREADIWTFTSTDVGVCDVFEATAEDQDVEYATKFYIETVGLGTSTITAVCTDTLSDFELEVIKPIPQSLVINNKPDFTTIKQDEETVAVDFTILPAEADQTVTFGSVSGAERFIIDKETLKITPIQRGTANLEVRDIEGHLDIVQMFITARDTKLLGSFKEASQDLVVIVFKDKVTSYVQANFAFKINDASFDNANISSYSVHNKIFFTFAIDILPTCKIEVEVTEHSNIPALPLFEIN